MPDDPVIWIIAIVVGGAVVTVALVLGGVVEVGLDPLRLSFRRKQAPGREKVSVLDDAEIEEAEIGNVSGVTRGAGTGEEGRVTDISVARGARIKGGKLGDVSGVRIAAGAKDEAPETAKDGGDQDR